MRTGECTGSPARRAPPYPTIYRAIPLATLRAEPTRVSTDARGSLYGKRFDLNINAIALGRIKCVNPTERA